MAATSAGFRRMALSLPETSEGAHMGHPDFRVRRKIFATICYPNEDWGMVKLTSEQQHEFMRAEPAVFVPVKGAWGRRGSTNVRLKAANRAILRRALLAAWRNTAPKLLVQQFGAKNRSSRKAAALPPARLGGSNWPLLRGKRG